MKQPNMQANDSAAQLAALAEQYSFAAYGHIGKSILGSEIPFLRIGHGERNIVYIAGDVACDDVSEPLLLQFAKDLCHFIEKDRSFFGICPSYLLQSRSLFLLPSINPDGRLLARFGADPACPLYERQMRQNGMQNDFSSWQGNARGVVPGLNFNIDFAERRRSFAASGAELPPMGEFPESENESAHLASALRTLTPLCLVQLCKGPSQTLTLGVSKPSSLRLGSQGTLPPPFPPSPGAWYHSCYQRPAVMFMAKNAHKSEYFRIEASMMEIIRLFCAR